jgi:hypothetical protein
MPHRVDSDPVGDRDDAGGGRLIELADDERAEVVDRRLRPVDGLEAVARLPFAQPDEVEPGPMELLRARPS